MSKKEQCSASERTFETVHEFCKARGITDASIEHSIRVTNDSWIKAGDLIRGGFRDYLKERWNEGHLAVRGLCPWLIDLMELGAKVNPPLIYDDGTVFVLWSRERTALLKELQHAYFEKKIATFSTTAGAEIERALDLRVTLVLRLLGCPMAPSDLEKCTEAKGFNWTLLSLLRASATMQKKALPKLVVRLSNNPQFMLLGTCSHGD